MYTFINRSIFVLVLIFSSLLYAQDATSASPTISSISDQFGDVSTVKLVLFTVDDIDSNIDALVLSATSSNQTLLQNGGIIFGGNGTNRDVRLRPAVNLSGITTVVITVSDGQNESSESFQYEVGTTTGGIAPTISIIDDQNTAVSTPITVNFSVDDADTDLNSLSLSATSSNQVILRDDKFIFGGSGGERDVRLKPAPGLSGSTTIVITVSDGQNENSVSFEFEVGAPASTVAPTISTINDQFTDVSVVKIVDFNVDDADTDVNTLVLSGSSNNQSLLPDNEVILGGTDYDRNVRLRPVFGMSGNATVVITASDGQNETSESFEFQVGSSNTQPTIDDIPNQLTEEDIPFDIVFNVADVETSDGELALTVTSDNVDLLPVENISFENNGSSRTAHLTPAVNQNGFAVVEITVMDGDNLQRTDGFVLEVTPVNDQPTIENLVDQNILQGTTSEFTFQVKDEEMEDSEIGVQATANNTGILKNENISIQTSAENRTITLTPVANRAGTVTVTVTATDDVHTISDSFKLVMERVDIDPVIEPINAVTMQLNSTEVVEVAVSDEDNANDLLIVTVSSGNQSLLPDNNIVITGGGANRTLTITPESDQFGQVTLTATVTDPQGGQDETSFLLTVNGNSAPTIDDIGPQTTNEDTSKAVTFQVGDAETPVNELDVSWASSNSTLLPDNKITMSENGSSRSLTMTPLGDQFGSSTITVIVSDGDKEQLDDFLLTVTADNDLPTITNLDDVEMLQGGSTASTINVSDVETSAIDLDVVVVSDNDQLLGASHLVLSGSGASRTLTITPPESKFGDGNVTLTVKDQDGAQVTTQFTVNVAAVTPAWAETGGTVSDKPLLGDTTQTSNFYGATPGQASADGGSAAYNIPIAIPSGRAGMQPSVSLAYNSRGGNGIAGVGFSLSAGSSISRCPPTLEQDNNVSNIQYDLVIDKLCLNGQRLILISGDYGYAGTEYRTELDDMTRVLQYGGDINSTASYFEVQLPNNKVQIYGQQTMVVAGGKSAPMSWQLDKEMDYSGNHISYHYQDYANGEVLLETIKYTGNSSGEGDREVRFDYEDRQDPRTYYQAGGATRTSKLLYKISTYYADDLVRAYNLAYAPSQANDRSLLKSVTECGYLNNTSLCRPATEFEWSEDTPVFQVEALISNEGSELIPTDGTKVEDITHLPASGDINGDGVRDWGSYFVDAEGSEWDVNDFQNNSCKISSFTYKPVCINGDFNMDGRSDVWKIDNDELKIAYTDYPSHSVTWLSTGINITSNSQQEDKLVNVADFNGDGWPDLILEKITKNAQGNILSHVVKLYLHSKNIVTPYDTAQEIFNWGDNPGSLSVRYLGDMDGNGLPDLAISSITTNVPQGALRTLLLTKFNGTTITFEQHSLDFGGDKTTGAFSTLFDANGDGLTDWLGWIDFSLANNELYLRLNKGNGEFEPAVALGPDSVLAQRAISAQLPNGEEYIERYIPKYNDAFKIADIDGDGKDELLIPGTLVATGCFTFQTYQANQWQTVTKCGDELYGDYRTASQTLAIPTSWDSSIYRYRALSIFEQSDSSIVSAIEDSPLIGAANNAFIVDGFGKGLPDMVFAYGCIFTDNCYFNSVDTGSPMYGLTENKIYISRNYGAFNTNIADTPTHNDYRAFDLLTQVQDGIGKINQWDYLPLSSGQVDDYYFKLGETKDDAHFNFASSMYTVAAFRQSNGLGSLNQYRYQYVDATYNYKGRGFRGFSKITQIDDSSEIRTETAFELIFPKTGRIKTQQTYALTGTTPFITVTNDWRENPNYQRAGLYHVYNHQSVSTTFDINTFAQISSTTATVYDIDEYGNVLNTMNEVIDDFGLYSTTQTGVYDEASYAWPHKMTSSTVIKTVAYENNVPAAHAGTTTSKTVSTKIDLWDNVRRKPIITTVAPGAVALDAGTCNNSALNACVTSVTSYNNYGLPTDVDVTGGVISTTGDTLSLETRTTSTTYTNNGISLSDDGYFPFEVSQQTCATINSLPLELVTTIHTLPATGQPLQVTDAAGMVSTTQYDSLGRPKQVDISGYPAQYTFYRTPDNNAPSNAIMMVEQYQQGKPTSAVYMDKLGRTLRSRTQQFDGSNAFTDTVFDAVGRTTAQSNVHSGSPVFTTYHDFDVLNRSASKVTPATDSSNEDVTTTYTYYGLKTTIETSAPDGANLNMDRSYNTLGQLMSTTDDKNGVTQYTYDGAGNPIVIKDAVGNSIYAQYDDMGRKLWVLDPNQGQTDFTYNDFGELEKEKDANGATIRYELDKLGRTTHRISPEGTAEFEWDTVKKGLLSWETAPGIAKTYAYDGSARPTTVTTDIDGELYAVTTEYDLNYGRPKSLSYPNGIKVALDYNEFGYLSHESNAASGYIYREITAQDVWGNMTAASLSDGVVQGNYSYSERTGQMLTSVVSSNGNDVHDLNYANYDSYGNIKTQHNLVTGINAREDFTYDSLHRLTQSNLNAGGTSIDINYAYDAVGNLTKKSDYSTNVEGAYQYVNGTNQLDSVSLKSGGTTTFAYDNKGNLTHRNGEPESVYNAFNKPTSINKNGTSISLYYGADLARYKQVRVVNEETITTHYIGKLYEVETKGTEVTTKTYISDVGIISQSSNDIRIRFTHRDRLGSASTFTDHNGQVTAYRSYDPFGAPKGGDWSILGIPQLSENLFDSDLVTRRGFTDHEHLDEAELIHMNGRVYDYNLGRFMSVDPLIQSPTNSQSINPYSYIMNNPLGGTDPTGYSSETVEVTNSTEVITDSDGNNYVDAGDGSGDLISIDSITVTSSNGSSATANFGSGGSLASTSVSDFGNRNDAATSAPAGATGINVDPVASGNNAEFNGTETVSTTPSSNTASIDTTEKTNWKRAFGEDGKQITEIRKSGKPKWSDLDGFASVLDEIMKKGLKLDFEILEQKTTVWEKWEQVEVSETYKTINGSLRNYQDKLIKVTRPQLTGRIQWFDTGRVVNTELVDFRACPFSCFNSGGGVINGFTGGVLGGEN